MSKAGQPSKYDPKYAKMFLDYFNVDPAKKTKEFPTKGGFAIRIGVHRDTLFEWAKKHPDFAEVYKRAEDFQERFLVNRGLAGRISPAFGIFALKNICNWHDKKDVEHSGKDGGPIRFSNLSDEELDKEIEKRMKTQKKGDESGKT